MLVVIGLIIGGVLVGRELINASLIRKTVTQKEQFSAALGAFTSKYRCLPGDCRGTLFGFTGSGNGDGLLAGVGASASSDEYKLFWRHLSEANLVEGSFGSLWYGSGPTVAGYHSPTCAVCAQFNYTYGSDTVRGGGWFFQQLQNYPHLNCSQGGTRWTQQGGQLPAWNAFILSIQGVWGYSNTVLTTTSAQAMDAKIDDGKPMTGGIVAISENNYSDAACSGDLAHRPALNRSGATSASAYTVSDSSRVNLIMRSDF